MSGLAVRCGVKEVKYPFRNERCVLRGRCVRVCTEVWRARAIGFVGRGNDRHVARIRSQIPPEGRIKHADVVIDTECTLDELKAKVEKLWKGLHVPEVDAERTTT